MIRLRHYLIAVALILGFLVLLLALAGCGSAVDKQRYQQCLDAGGDFSHNGSSATYECDLPGNG